MLPALLPLLMPMLMLIADVSPEQYSRQWAVHLEGGQQAADLIATRHGFTNLGQVCAELSTKHCHYSGLLE